MRTLDEVIAEMEGMEFIGTLGDALYYLKEYKIKRERIMAKVQDCEDAEKRLQDEIAVYKEILTDYVALKQYWAEQQENNPLTWDELKSMTGKPVWVEYNFCIDNKDFRDKSKRWCIIREFKPWHDTEIIITENGFILSKSEQIKEWQAYRKERYEPD